MLLIVFQCRLNVVSGPFVGNVSRDILANLVVGGTYPVCQIRFSLNVGSIIGSVKQEKAHPARGKMG